MPWMMNPFTKSLNYYEIGVPEGGVSGEILTVSSDGSTVEWTEATTTIGSTVASTPPTGSLRVTNLYVDSVTGKLEVEYDDTEGDTGTVISNPPTGHFRVTNLHRNPTGRLVVEYDDTPQG